MAGKDPLQAVLIIQAQLIHESDGEKKKRPKKSQHVLATLCFGEANTSMSRSDNNMNFLPKAQGPNQGSRSIPTSSRNTRAKAPGRNGRVMVGKIASLTQIWRPL